MTLPRLLALLLPGLAVAVVAGTAVAVVAGTAPPASGQGRAVAARATDPRLAELMTRFEKAQEETKTMRASFRQVKEDELFAEPTVLTGRFAFRDPDLFRWDYGVPEAVTVIATPDFVRQFIPGDPPLLRETNISKKRRRAMNYLGIGSDVQNLRRHFDIDFIDDDEEHEGADKIELRGKNRRVRKRLTLLEMWIDRATSLPRAVRTTMADGGRTSWVFADMEVNVELAPKAFDLAVPAGTRVERGGRRYGTVVGDLLDDVEEDLEEGDDDSAGTPAGTAPGTASESGGASEDGGPAGTR